LHLNNGVRLAELALKLRATPLQLRNAPLLRAELGLPAAPSSERSQRTGLTLAARLTSGNCINRILREQIDGRLLLSDSEKKTLAEIGYWLSWQNL
jgi:hypothetical protein